MLIHNSLHYLVLSNCSSTSSNETEFLILEISNKINLKKYSHLLAIVYGRPGGFHLTDFSTSFSQSYKNIAILGDFNCDMLSDSNYSTHLSSIISERALFLVPYGATHINDVLSTFIDLALIDDRRKIMSFAKSPAPLAAGHHAIMVDYKLPAEDARKKFITYRSFKNCDSVKFSSDVLRRLSSLVGNNSLDTQLDPSLLIGNSTYIISLELDNHAPFVSRKLREIPAQWMTSEIKQLCKECDAIYKRARRLGSSRLLHMFEELRRDIKSRITIARQTYLRDQIAALSETSDQSQICCFLSKKGITKDIYNPTECRFSAKELNDHYVSVASVHPCCSVEVLNSMFNYESNVTSLFLFREVTLSDVHNAVRSLLPKSKGHSPDGLPFKYIRGQLDQLMPTLVEIFNLSLGSCLYPDLWKRAYIIIT